MKPERLSVPPHTRRPPREITTDERLALLGIADCLIPATDDMPSPSKAPGIERWLDRALAARSDAFGEVMELASRLGALQPSARESQLRQLHAERANDFLSLTSVLVGAYVMVPEIRAAIGYPGQGPSHPAFDEAANEIMDGILDPVIERGSIYVVPPDLAEPSEAHEELRARNPFLTPAVDEQTPEGSGN